MNKHELLFTATGFVLWLICIWITTAKKRKSWTLLGWVVFALPFALAYYWDTGFTIIAAVPAG